MHSVRAPSVAAILCAALFSIGCGFGEDRSTVAAYEDHAGRAERYRREAMTETAELARRVCSRVPPRVLARALGGDAFSRTDTTPNAIALGYARDVDISPLPLQRAAYDGCTRGVRRRASG